jgi:hypothetical protein
MYSTVPTNFKVKCLLTVRLFRPDFRNSFIAIPSRSVNVGFGPLTQKDMRRTCQYHYIHESWNKNVRAEVLREGEKVVFQEDCAEDDLKSGVLTLTNQRLLFEKTEGKMTTLWKEAGDLILNIDLANILNVEARGFLIAKVVISVGEYTYKFGVLNPGKWEKLIRKQIASVNI